MLEHFKNNTYMTKRVRSNKTYILCSYAVCFYGTTLWFIPHILTSYTKVGGKRLMDFYFLCL